MILVDLFVAWARVGLLGFGGGPSMIPLMEAECTAAGWVDTIDERDPADGPGPRLTSS